MFFKSVSRKKMCIRDSVEADWTGELKDGYFAVNTEDVTGADLYLDQCSVQRIR